jgi:uncharacterized membrane protein
VTADVDESIVDATIYPGSASKTLSKSITLSQVSYGSYDTNFVSNLEGIANGLNQSGEFTPGKAVGAYQVTPQFFESTPYVDGFLWSNGAASLFPSRSNWTYTQPLVTNNPGQVVGYFWNEPVPLGGSLVYQPPAHGFVWTKGDGFTKLDAPNARQTWLTSINDAGWIVGYYEDQNVDYHCILIKPAQGTSDDYGSGASITPFDEPGETSGIYDGCAANSINGLGQIVGGYSPVGPYLDDAEAGAPGVSPVDLPGGAADGINNNGLIAGTDSTYGGVLVIPPFTEIVLDPDTSAEFSGINDDIEITGSNSSGAFILDTPH